MPASAHEVPGQQAKHRRSLCHSGEPRIHSTRERTASAQRASAGRQNTTLPQPTATHTPGQRRRVFGISLRPSGEVALSQIRHCGLGGGRGGTGGRGPPRCTPGGNHRQCPALGAHIPLRAAGAAAVRLRGGGLLGGLASEGGPCGSRGGPRCGGLADVECAAAQPRWPCTWLPAFAFCRRLTSLPHACSRGHVCA